MFLNLLRKLKFLPKLMTRVLLIALIRYLPQIWKQNTSITFAAENADDGTGAQIQRLIGARALALLLRTPYRHTPIEKVAIHPFDPFKTVEEMKGFVKRINQTFDFQSEINITNQQAILLTNPQSTDLITIFFRIVFKKSSAYQILNPYSLIDIFPQFYRKALALNLKKDLIQSSPSNALLIHYRQGVGSFAIYPGMKQPRQIPLEIYISRIKELQESEDDSLVVTVLTDAPPRQTEYSVPKEQSHLWEGTPAFSNGTMKISALDIKEVFIQNGINAKVILGGDPLDAILLMANAKVFLMSKSSLSYIGALLSNSENIFYPRGFWHPKLSKWKYL